ncbi:hypothetical protein SK128_009809 [Halocaridina rubra]|uniref:Uncharacterized protein n=1 Tax=Halocaridina rubra TaxID=373956 RepID=A0AAN8XHL3_HALRR
MAALVPVIVVEADCEWRWWAGALISMAEVGNCIAFVGGSFYLAVDLAPAFAATLFGLSNFSMAINGFIAPMAVALLTPNGTRHEWRLVFWSAAALNVLGIIIFILWGSAETLPWATLDSPSSDCKRENATGQKTIDRKFTMKIHRKLKGKKRQNNDKNAPEQ